MGKYPSYVDVTSGSFQFPSRDVSEQEKDGAPYSLDYSKAIYNRYLNDKAGVLYSSREKLDIIRLYGKGSQPISIYQNWQNDKVSADNEESVLNQYRSDGSRKGWENISQRVISPLPRIRTIIMGYLDQVGQDVFVDTIDAISNDEKDNIKWRMFTIAQNMEFINEYHTKAGIPQKDLEYLPVNSTELNLYESMGGFKMNYARAMEKIIRHTEKISEVDDQLKDDWIDDAVDLGVIAARVVYDPNIKKYRYRYMDPKNVVIQFVKRHDYERSEWAGYVEPYTISELKQVLPDKSEDFFKEIAAQYRGRLGNRGTADMSESDWDNFSKHKNGVCPYDDFLVDVLEVEWIDYEAERTLIYANKHGRKVAKPLSKDSEVNLTANQKKRGSRDMKTKIRKLRGAKYIIGTDVVFDHGRVNMADRPKQTDVMHSFRVYTLRDHPITEQLIPIADDMAMAWYRWQDDRAMLQRYGYTIDVGMMENIDVGGGDYNFLNIIKMWRDTRHLLHQQSNSGKYEGGSTSPIQPIQSLVKEALEEFIMTWEAALKRIEDVTGINLVMLGATAPQGSQVATTQMSAASAVHVLKPIIKSVGRMKKELAETTMRRLQLAFKARKDIADGYADVVGEADVELLRMAEKDAVQYGMSFEDRPSEKTKEIILGGASASLQARRDGKPGIDIAQFMYIAQQLESGGNVKELSALLDYLNSKSEKQVQENKEKDIQMQGQQLQQAQQQKIQGEAQARKEDIQGEMMVNKAASDNKIREMAFEKGVTGPPQGAPQAPIQPSSPPQGSQGPPQP